MAARWPFYATVAVLGFGCLACIIAGSIEWGDQAAMITSDPAEATEQARFAIEIYAIGAFNLIALIAFLSRGWAWWLALGVQVAAVGLGVFEAMRTGDSPGWFFFSVVPLLSLVLLIAFRAAQPRPGPALSTT